MVLPVETAASGVTQGVVVAHEGTFLYRLGVGLLHALLLHVLLLHVLLFHVLLLHVLLLHVLLIEQL